MSAAHSTETSKTLELRITVDKRKMRLVYAECDRYMADVLLSFLTTPVAALVRRTKKSSGMSSMDSLYKSVEDMDLHQFMTPECRQLLLRPKSSIGFAHHSLKLLINDVDGALYWCSAPSQRCPKVSLFPGVKCDCRRDMIPRHYGEGDDEVFISKRAGVTFTVTDDLLFSPSSDALKQRLCIYAGVQDACDLEERIVQVDSDQMVHLMKASLLSCTPLSDTFLASNFGTKPVHLPLQFLQRFFIENHSTPHIRDIIKKQVKHFWTRISSNMVERKLAITLFHDQEKVLYAVVDKSFIDLIFSFLTFPFGAIVAAFKGNSPLRCMNNLYKVVERFRTDGLLRKTSKKFIKNLLNAPIAVHHDCETKLLKIGNKRYPLNYIKCRACDKRGYVLITCKDPKHVHFELEILDPKYDVKPTTKKEEGYMRMQESFVITNALCVKPIYNLTQNLYTTGLKKRTVLFGRKKAMKLLMASLVSDDPLTSVFLQPDAKYYEKKCM